MEISLEEICQIVAGRPSPGRLDQKVRAVATDSRKAVADSLFVAFVGENVDGHNYLLDSSRRGAIAALVERETEAPEGFVTIRVDNTQDALQRLAAWHRRQFNNVQVLGITGSSGKTTTKELAAAVLAQEYSVLKTPGNQNNEIGLPMTMFALEEEYQWAVLEMGMSAPGEIRQLCWISQPAVGIITNIGVAHMAFLGSKEAISAAKFELAEDLAPPGLLILNGDDALQRCRAAGGLPRVERTVFYGLDPGNDYRAAKIDSSTSGSRFEVHWQGKSILVTLNLPGRHNISNALAAFAAGVELGIPPEKIVLGLAQVRGEVRRGQAFEIRGLTVIDDSYNANPDSARCALEVLSSYPPERRKVAFLGDMLELGEIAPEKHQQLGADAAANGVELLVAVGRFAEHIRRGAIRAGMDGAKVFLWPDSAQAIAAVEFLEPGDVVLVKGSLGIKMDIIVQYLKDGGQ